MSAFEVLGLAEDCSHEDVLKAWRKLARVHHPDKTNNNNNAAADNNTTTTTMQALNAAKEACLLSIIERKFAVSEREYVMHICRVLEKSLAENCGLHIDLGEGELVRPTLRKFFFARAANAMEWVMRCGVGDMAFDQETEEEIPVLCAFYNDYIGHDDDAWSKHEQTIMTVLSKYDAIKAGGYGNFARFLE